MIDYPAGWTCERTLMRLEYYLLGTLSLAESLAVAEHLEACDGCSQRLVLYRPTLAVSRG
ncbi:MAG TPA: zf-HC2 domain-containing protein [Gemmatimonadales bacterium]|jgi:anti-sigma factor RsiW|nr:zf-HC2 domain-containing protein [Gemmatimonadales bacterium]